MADDDRVTSETENEGGARKLSSGGISQLFAACDLNGSGFIEQDELRAVCDELSSEELADVFKQLDNDEDGKISLEEFADGFQAMRDTMMSMAKERQETQEPIATAECVRRMSMCIQDLRRTSRDWRSTDGGQLQVDRQPADRRKSVLDLIGNIDEGFTALSSQELICEMYQSLHDTGLQDQLSKFQDILVSVIKDVRKQQCENDRLERSYQREKDEHSKHLRHLEEDMETQMQKVEQRVRTEEREKYQTLCNELKAQKELEIDELQSNLSRLQELDAATSQERPISDDTRARLDELTEENRSLRRSLTDAQTSLALQRSEVANVKAQCEEKCYELAKEKHALVEYMKEHENLTRQIHMLHDANKSLHDTNDDLREAMENARSASKRPRSVRYRSRRSSTVRASHVRRLSSVGSRGDYVRRYLQQTAVVNASAEPSEGSRDQEEAEVNRGEVTSLAEELGLVDSESRDKSRSLLPAHDSCEVDSLPEDRDSGHFTIRDVVYDEYSDEENSAETPAKQNRNLSARHNTGRASSTVGSQVSETFDVSTTPCSSRHGSVAGGTVSGTTSRSRGFLDGARTSTDRGVSGAETVADDLDSYSVAGISSVVCSRCSYVTECDVSDSVSNVVATTPQKAIAHEAERIFKIVLAGDAAVGKSSFILRLCKNKFVANLNSTLGVDFQTKTVEVGGRIIALQLWDTAGQERFRSIAKSYFRRADGVLLLYDVTYERSFINVRDWLEAIEESAHKRLPIMLVGNKSDLRTEQATSVKPEDGQRLAREVQGLFIESSAKDGRNVLEAVTELSRMLITNEDLEVQTIGLQLHDSSAEPKKRSPCCSNR